MTLKMVGFRFLFAVPVFLLTTAAARADFLITGSNEDVAAGSTATVSFFISSAAADQLAGFQLELQIVATPVNSGVLQFSPLSSQPDPYNASNYVFPNGNSSDQGYPFWYSVSSSIPGGPLDLATGADSTADGTAVSFSSTASYLLATVQIDATNAVGGDTYQIGLVPMSGTGSSNSPSYFQDASGNYIGYSSIAANITITSEGPLISIVPAPPSIVLLLSAVPAGLVFWRRSRKSVVEIPAVGRQ